MVWKNSQPCRAELLVFLCVVAGSGSAAHIGTSLSLHNAPCILLRAWAVPWPSIKLQFLHTAGVFGCASAVGATSLQWGPAVVDRFEFRGCYGLWCVFEVSTGANGLDSSIAGSSAAAHI
jgi:hypothetical protein